MNIVKDFFVLQNNYFEDKIDVFGGKVCIFGLYRFGVYIKGKKKKWGIQGCF